MEDTTLNRTGLSTESVAEAVQPEISAAQPVKRGRPTLLPSGTTQREAKKHAKRQKEYRDRIRGKKLALQEAIARDNYLDESLPNEERAKEILSKRRNVSAEHLDSIYKLAVEAAQESGLPANDCWFEHGARKTQESIESGAPQLLEPVQDRNVEGQLSTRCDLHCIWDYSVSWREERLSFEDYLQLILDIKDDFFKLNEICEKDFARESYESWAELMPKLDPRKLCSGYTQAEMRKFLNVSEVKQRLLVASRNSMKSSFILLWLVQLILICPDARILLVTETNALSAAFVRQLRLYFVVQAGGPTRLQQLFPQYCIPEGDGKALEFRCPMAHLGLTVGVACSSMESGGFAGSRNDICVFDDPLSENTVGTEKAVQKTISKYDAIRKLGEVGALGSIVILTPWHPDDLGAELQQRNAQAEAEGNYAFLAHRIDPAFEVKPHAREKAKENLLSLSEEDVVLRFKRLDWKFLRSEMQAGRAENFKFFRSQNLCSWEGLEDESTRCTFEEAELRARTKPRDFFEPAISQAVIDTVLSVDTAWSVAKWADYSALVLTKVCHRNNATIAIVTDCSMGRWKISELAVHIVETIHQSNPTRVVIEKSGSWQSLADEIKKAAMLRGYLLPHIYWKPCNLGGGTAKSKALRIKSLETMIADNTLFFVQAPFNDQLFQQLVSFDGVSNSVARKNDGPDALALGMETFFPGAVQTEKSEAAEKAEQDAIDASLRAQSYNRIFGNDIAAIQQPASVPRQEQPNRGVYGIPGLRPLDSGNPGRSSPLPSINRFGSIHIKQ